MAGGERTMGVAAKHRHARVEGAWIVGPYPDLALIVEDRGDVHVPVT